MPAFKEAMTYHGSLQRSRHEADEKLEGAEANRVSKFRGASELQTYALRFGNRKQR
jgi:hypothetical protein